MGDWVEGHGTGARRTLLSGFDIGSHSTPLLREILLGFVRVHVLHHAAEEPFFGSWMMEELASHGYDVGPGTLYPILHRMEEDGYLTSEERTEGGRVRRYYSATALGREALAEARAKAAELTREVAPPSVPPAPQDDAA